MLLPHSTSPQDAQCAEETPTEQTGAGQSPAACDDGLAIGAPARSQPDEADGDPIWPASRLAEVGIERLDQTGLGHGYEHWRYDDAFGGPAAAIAGADADAWPAVSKTIRTVRMRLSPSHPFDSIFSVRSNTTARRPTTTTPTGTERPVLSRAVR